MRRLISVFVLATSLVACSPKKPEVRQNFKICWAEDNTALVSPVNSDSPTVYEYGGGWNGQVKFRPQSASDMVHPAFMVVSKIDRYNTSCQIVVGQIID